jgi:benzil reductase ((S)-benzoin forming)
MLEGKLYQHAACDLARPALIAASVTPALRALAARKPAAVTLINNAAVATPTGVVGKLDAAEIEGALLTNAAAPVVMADLFLRTFADDSVERRIVNISSGAAQTAIPGSAVYSLSKAALEMLTRSIAVEHNEPRFRCVSLRPGIFETGMQAYMRSRDPAEFPSVGLFRGFKENGLLKDPAEVAERIIDRLIVSPVENGRTYTHTDL